MLKTFRSRLAAAIAPAPEPMDPADRLRRAVDEVNAAWELSRRVGNPEKPWMLWEMPRSRLILTVKDGPLSHAVHYDPAKGVL